jgi:hypothetical protein
MKAKLRTLLMLFLCIALFTGCDEDKQVKEYGYRFYESTGQNQYIIMEGREVPVKTFIADASNPVALKSLRALRWDVLYPNDDGDKIFLRGEYDHQSQSFRLSHWYIKVPFEKLVIEDETHIPHNVHKATSHSLERTDFEPKNGFDPHDPTFDPKSFQKAAQ